MTDAIEMPKRRWFQFRLRTLFVVVAVVALPLGWLSWRIEHKRRERAAVAAIEELGGLALYEWQLGRFGIPNPPGPPWLRRLFGDDFFGNVKVVFLDSNEILADGDLVHLTAFANLESLIIRSSKLTDAGLIHLKGLRSMFNLSLECECLTDNGVADLQRALPNCDINR
jgi:hypothetical protein